MLFVLQIYDKNEDCAKLGAYRGKFMSHISAVLVDKFTRESKMSHFVYFCADK